MTAKRTGRPPKELPPGRALVYAALVQFKASNDGLSPTVLDLCDMTGLAESSVKYHLLKLTNEGKIVKQRQGYTIPGARWLPPVDQQPTPDQDQAEQPTPPAKMDTAPLEDMAGNLRRERDHYQRASAANLVEADTARAQLAKVEGELSAARAENKRLRAQVTERDETIAVLRAELAKRTAGRPVPVRFVPAPAALGMTG